MPAILVETLALLACLHSASVRGDYALELGEARLLLIEGRPEAALERARALNRRVPDDLDGYALIVDAARALHRLPEAERAAQWMLDIRPDDVRGLLRAADLRADLGDLSGAAQLLAGCYRSTPIARPENRASILSQLAAIYERQGNAEKAARAWREAHRLRGLP